MRLQNRRCIIITSGAFNCPESRLWKGFLQKNPDTCGYGLNRDLWDLGITGIDVKCVLRGDAAHSQGDLGITGIDVKPKVLAWKSDSGLDENNRCATLS